MLEHLHSVYENELINYLEMVQGRLLEIMEMDADDMWDELDALTDEIEVYLYGEEDE